MELNNMKLQHLFFYIQYINKLHILHRPKRKMRQTFYKKIKNRSINLFGDINALLKSIILFDDYSDY